MSAPQRSSWGLIEDEANKHQSNLTQRCMTPLVLMQSPTSPAQNQPSMMFSQNQRTIHDGSYFNGEYSSRTLGSLSRPIRPTSTIGFEPGSPLSPQSPPSGHRAMSSSSTDTSMSSLSGIPPMKPSRLTTEDLLNLIHQGKRRDSSSRNDGQSTGLGRVTAPASSFQQAASSLISTSTASSVSVQHHSQAYSSNANHPNRSATPMAKAMVPAPRTSQQNSQVEEIQQLAGQSRSASAIPFSNPSQVQKPSAAQTVIGSRRSWCIEPGQPGCRRSLASDRLGPMKPTSINDFKKLLISKARPPSAPGDRRSAAELLQVKTSPQSLSSLTSPSSSSSAGSTPRRPFTPLVLSQETSPTCQNDTPPKTYPKPQRNEVQKPSQFHGQLYPIGASGQIIKPRVLRTIPRRHYGGGMNGYLSNGSGSCLPVLEENRLEETENQDIVNGSASKKEVYSHSNGGMKMGPNQNSGGDGMIAVARPAHVQQAPSPTSRGSPDGGAKTPNPNSTSTWV